MDPLAAEATVQLDWLLPTDTVDRYDAVLLPGSKQTMADLKAMQAARMDERLQRYVAAGGVVLAICGGLQMLGQRLHDPQGLEAETPGDMAGLGLLPLVTRFRPDKVQRQWTTTTTWPEPGQPCTGFELHHGRTTALTHGAQPLYAQSGLGWVSPCGRVVGTYLHGCLEAGPWRSPLAQPVAEPPWPAALAHSRSPPCRPAGSAPGSPCRRPGRRCQSEALAVLIVRHAPIIPIRPGSRVLG